MLPTLPDNKDISWCNAPDLQDYDHVVIFHHPCNDGFGSAFVAWNALNPKKTLFVPMNYKDKLPLEIITRKFVYILDFSFPPDILADIVDAANYVWWLDHHESAIKEHFPDVKESNFIIHGSQLYSELSSTRSGALLAHHYFFPARKVPKLIRHISDRDLWNFELPGTKEIHAYLSTIPMTFIEWENFMLMLESPVLEHKIIDTGSKLLVQYQNYIKQHRSKININNDLKGRSVAYVNCSSMFSSDLGSLILEENPGIDYCVLFNFSRDEIHVSLRSRKGGVNVAEIAKKYGGGGHQSAAGFILPNQGPIGILNV